MYRPNYIDHYKKGPIYLESPMSNSGLVKMVDDNYYTFCIA